MNRRSFTRCMSIAGVAVSRVPVRAAKTEERPNILWITSEDNSPLFGCYGDGFATTPNFDRFAQEGILYENAFANAPVCAPARHTIITGMYPPSLGTEHMRSKHPVPDFIKPFVHYLRQVGYYCTNNSKTDYNTSNPWKQTAWDECGGKAHYRNRKSGQPFFSVFNITLSHESNLHEKKLSKRREKTSDPRHDPSGVALPSYHPDTPEIRRDWAFYYDIIEDLDSAFAARLRELEASGEAENTIVMYYGDHGGVLCRSKRFVYDSGTRVPMLLRVPEKFKHLAPAEPGSRLDRVVSFVDLAPSLLALAGIAVPSYMQGKPFLGPNSNREKDYLFMFRGRMDERYDLVRSLRDKRYRYIRNYMPHRIPGQHLQFLWQAANTRSWEREYRAGRCNEAQSRFWQTKPSEELYDTQADPWEVKNLADDPAMVEILERLRCALRLKIRSIRDGGFIPEGEMVRLTGLKNCTAYDLVHASDFPIERIIETADMATERNPELISSLMLRMNEGDSCVRYWAATGCVILGPEAQKAQGALERLLGDPSPSVRIAAAEALIGLGETRQPLVALKEAMLYGNPFESLHALNVIDVVGEKARPLLADIEQFFSTTEDTFCCKVIPCILKQLKELKER